MKYILLGISLLSMFAISAHAQMATYSNFQQKTIMSKKIKVDDPCCPGPCCPDPIGQPKTIVDFSTLKENNNISHWQQTN